MLNVFLGCALISALLEELFERNDNFAHPSSLFSPGLNFDSVTRGWEFQCGGLVHEAGMKSQPPNWAFRVTFGLL